MRRRDLIVVAQDGTFEILEHRTGLETELFREELASGLVDPQRITRTARPMKGTHQEGPQPFAVHRAPG